MRSSFVIRLWLGLIAVLAISGCASSQQVARKQGHGKDQIFVAPFDKAWPAAINAVYANKLTVLTTNLNREGGYISAQRGFNFTSIGENIGVWVTPASPTETRVEVVSRLKGPMVWVKNWEDPVLASVGAELSMSPVQHLARPGMPESGLNYAGASGNLTDKVTAANVSVQNANLSAIDLQQRYNELRAVQVLRSEELRLERDPRGRAVLESELEYLNVELQTLRDRSSRPNP